MPQPCPWPPDLRDWLFAALRVPPSGETQPALLEPLYQLQQRWVAGSTAIAGDYADLPATWRSYALYYLPINMAKLAFVLERAPRLLTGLPSDGPWDLVEAGCGPGTNLWATLFWLRAQAPAWLARLRTVRGVDRSTTALTLARRLAEGLRRWPEFDHLHFDWQVADWQAAQHDERSLLVIGHVLTECPEAAPTAGQLPLPGALIAIEPGTHRDFQHLLPWRAAWLAAGYHLHFPCPQAATCPMTGGDNWCHFDINRFQLAHVQRMSMAAKRLNPRHHFSAFAFSRPTAAPSATPLAAAAPVGDPWRVLSRLRKENRSGIRWLCDGAHLVEAVLNRHERSPDNRLFLDAEPGDLLRLLPARGAAAFRRDARLRTPDQVRGE